MRVNETLFASFVWIAKKSICPLADWEDRVAPWLAQGSMTFVNVGANKGYAVQNFLARYANHQHLQTTGNAWKQALLSVDPAVWRPCGACSACRSPAPKVVFNASSINVYALEYMSQNVKLLEALFQTFRVPGKVYHFAVTNRRDKTYFEPPKGTLSGDERWGLHTASRHNAGQPVRTVTLDAFVVENNIDRIHYLSSDTEGNDALVLEGAKHLIELQKIDLIEFEYHGQGAWLRRSLKAVLAWLYTSGYECFWQGNFGRVAPASGPFWQEQFELKVWSNLVCSHIPQIILEFYKMSIIGYDRKRPQDQPVDPQSKKRSFNIATKLGP
jgi:FkbM family methyltransferase